MKSNRRTEGSASIEQLATLLLVGVVGMVGFQALGGGMQNAIAGESGSGSMTSPLAMGAGALVTASEAAASGYTVQVIAYGKGRQGDAQAYANKLRAENGFDAFVEQTEGGLWVVRINHVSSAGEADDILDQYAALGLTNDAYVTDHSGVVTPNEKAFYEAVAAQQAAEAAAAAEAAQTPVVPEPTTADEPSTDKPTTTATEPKADKPKAEKKDDGGFSLWGAVSGTLNGIKNGFIGAGKQAFDMGKGLVLGGKALLWDYGFKQNLLGSLAWVGKVVTAPVNAIFGTEFFADTSWIPAKEAWKSLGNFIVKTPAALGGYIGGVGHQASLCLNPVNNQSSSGRGQACGRIVTEVASVVVLWTKAGKAGSVAASAGELGAGASKAGTAAKVAGELGTGSEVASATTRIAGELGTGSGAATKAGEAGSAASKAGEAGSASTKAADAASSTAKTADAAETAGNTAKAADEAGEAASTSSTAGKTSAAAKETEAAAMSRAGNTINVAEGTMKRLVDNMPEDLKYWAKDARSKGTLETAHPDVRWASDVLIAKEKIDALATRYRTAIEAGDTNAARSFAKSGTKQMDAIFELADAAPAGIGSKPAAAAAAPAAAKTSGGGLWGWLKSMW